jgi:DNA polymerase/3'-5' exonuclease PolX
MKYVEVIKIAERVRAQPEPFFIIREIAGSIRRKKSEVKDIEIVAIPKP